MTDMLSTDELLSVLSFQVAGAFYPYSTECQDDVDAWFYALAAAIELPSSAALITDLPVGNRSEYVSYVSLAGVRNTIPKSTSSQALMFYVSRLRPYFVFGPTRVLTRAQSTRAFAGGCVLDAQSVTDDPPREWADVHGAIAKTLVGVGLRQVPVAELIRGVHVQPPAVHHEPPATVFDALFFAVD